MFSNRARAACSLALSMVVTLVSCGGGASSSTSTNVLPPASTTPTTSVPQIVNIAAAPQTTGTKDCGAAWMASLQQLTTLSPTKPVDDVQILSWNDYERGSQIEAGVDNCVSITSTVAADTLSWDATGNTDTIDHYSVYATTDGNNLTLVAKTPPTAKTLALSTLNLNNDVQYSLFVQAVGKPSVLNKLSSPSSYRRTTKHAPVIQLVVSPTSGPAPLAITSSIKTVDAFTSDSIDFGDGTVVTTTSGSHKYNSAGTFSVKAVVTNADGLSSSASATVTVTAPPNQPPVAALSVTPSTGTTPVTVNASTTGSSDADGTIASTKIDFGDGTILNAASGSHTYATAGTYTVKATVTDNSGATASATSAVTASTPANQPPVAKLSVTPTSGTAPVTVNASTTGSSDPDGTIASTKIDFGDGTIINAASGSHTYSTAGTFALFATVTDNGGLSSTTSSTVVVTAANQPPVAKLAVTPNSGTVPVTVTASTAGSTDPDGTIASTKIDFGDGTIVNAASGTHTYTTVGTYTVKSTVADTSGATASAMSTVTVISAIQRDTAAVTVKVYPSSSSIPVYGIQSITAAVQGTNQLGVTWSNNCGLTTIGSGNTVGFKSTTQQTCTITAAASDGATATSSVTWIAAQTPVTAHPRVFFDSNDLVTLRANAGNATWNTTVGPAATAAAAWVDPKWNYSAACDGTGTPTGTWLDDGNPGSTAQYVTEQYAMLFAFMSMVDPAGQAARNAWACKSKDLILWELGHVAESTAPFTADSFGSSNRAAGSGEAFSTTVDWLQAGNYLTSAQLQTIVAPAFRVMIHSDIVRGITSGDTMKPIGSASYNSTALLTSTDTFGGANQFAWADNNYYASKVKMLALMGLALDPGNDPVQNLDGQSDPYYVNTSGYPNSVRAAAKNFLGGRLYQMYAVWEDRDIAAAVLNNGTPMTLMGKANGGYEIEGMEYGGAQAYFLQALYAANKAGVLDLQSYPQGSLYWSSQWHNWMQVLAHQTATAPSGTDNNIGGSYWVPVNGYGDMTSYSVFKTYWQQAAEMMGLLATPEEKQFIQWWDYNVPQGTTFQSRQTAIGSSYMLDPIMNYAMYATTTPGSVADNRSTLYGTRYIAGGANKGFGKVVARTDWTANATVFDATCSLAWHDHEPGRCGVFQLWRKGEHLIHQGISYDLQYTGATGSCRATNAPCIVNTNIICNGWAKDICTYGGQYQLAQQTANPTLRLFSYGPNYAASSVVMTGMYNTPYGYGGNGVTHASRDILWISPDYVVDYTRAATGSTNLAKSVSYSTSSAPIVSGQVATVTTARGQKVYIQAVLPAGAAVTSAGVLYKPTDKETTTTDVIISAPGAPASTQFLTVTQAADGGTPQMPVNLVLWSAGTTFDGAAIGKSLVMFKRNLSDSFVGVSYPASGATAHYVANLMPNRAYDVTRDGSTTSITSDSSGVLSFGASGTGSISIGN